MGKGKLHMNRVRKGSIIVICMLLLSSVIVLSPLAKETQPQPTPVPSMQEEFQPSMDPKPTGQVNPQPTLDTELPPTEEVEGKPSASAEKEESSYEDLWDETNEAYMIATAEDLKLFRNSMYQHIDYTKKTVYLINDIILEPDTDIGTVGSAGEQDKPVFEGTFDGRGHSIEGWTNGEEALFAVIGKEGKVCNLAMKNVNLEQAALGAVFAFQNTGSIACCFVSGSISGNNNHYASFAYGNIGSISNCVSSAYIATTKKKSQLAGITYDNMGNVSNCIYYGTLSTTQTKQIALYGIANKNVINSYYLDKGNYKKIGTSCTEEEMKQQSTYKEFDFEHIWSIDPQKNEGYPELRTDFPDLEFITKVPVSMKVQIEDYIFDQNSRMGSCYFPLNVSVEYAGNSEKIRKQFSELVSRFHVTTSLRTEKWKKDFLVDIPVNGVSRDFSKTSASDYFDFHYDSNNEFEFYVTDCEYTSTIGTYYDQATCNNVLTTEQKEEKIAQAESAVRTILNLIYEKYGQEAMDNTWFAFTAARADYYPAGTSKDAMFERISNVWREYKDYQVSVGKRPETTETSRFVLAVTALGFDPTDVAGDNLIKELIQSDPNGKYFAQHYLAYALYSGRYGDYMSYVRNMVKEQAASSKKDVYSADDMAVMYMQPVFLMYNPNASSASEEGKITKYIEEEVIPWLKRSITGFGTFYSPYTHCNNNVWTDAQAQMLLALLKVNFLDEGFVKNGNTILDYIIENPEISLDYKGDESQCARALVSLIRCYKGKPDLFDCLDVTGVRQVEDMISKLPSVISESDAMLVHQVENAFWSLTTGQRKQVDNKAVLEHALASLTQIQIDKDVARELMERIDAIGTVTLEKQSYIKQIRVAYNKMTPAQKELVTNYPLLIDAETTLKRLQEEAAKKKADVDKSRQDKKRKTGHSKKEKSKKEKQEDENGLDNTEREEEKISTADREKEGADKRSNKDRTKKYVSLDKNARIAKVEKEIYKDVLPLDQNKRTKKNIKIRTKAGRARGSKGKKHENITFLPDEVAGRSSLILNGTLEEEKKGISPVFFWCCLGTSGIGLFLLAVGIRIKGKPIKEEKREQENEKENR